MNANIRKGKMRKGAIQVDVYNEGLTVFLYDWLNENRIREADPKIIWFAGTEAFEDKTTKKLLAAGDLLVYGLHGDSGIDAEIIVGDPLSKAELAGKKWFSKETGFLLLPTGNLCVHSYNSLPMGDNGDEPTDEGAFVSIPAGKYKVTLYRIDLTEMEKAGIEVNEEEAKEIIVFTPTDKDLRASNILFRECLV